MFPYLIVNNHGQELFRQKMMFGFNSSSLHDNYDKLVYLVTTVILIFCYLFSSNNNYYHTEFQCTTPTSVIAMQFIIDYYGHYCWTHGVVPIRSERDIPQTYDKWVEKEDSLKITYYQWLPQMYGIMCVVAFFPRCFWKSIAKSNVFHDIVVHMKHVDYLPSQNADSEINSITGLLHESLTIYRKSSVSRYFRFLERHFTGIPFCRYLSTYLVGWYFLTKVLFIGSGVFNLWIMKYVIAFPADGFHDFYKEVFVNVFNEANWMMSLYFPITSICIDKEMRVLESKNMYMSQCIVQQNLFNRFIISFLAGWSICIIVTSTVGLCVWMNRIYRYRSRRRYVKKLLRNVNAIDGGKMDAETLTIFNGFMKDYLKYDGVLKLHMLSMKIGEVIVSKMTASMWSEFQIFSRNNNLKFEA